MTELPDSIEELIQELVKAKQEIEYNPPPVGGYTLHRDRTQGITVLQELQIESGNRLICGGGWR